MASDSAAAKARTRFDSPLRGRSTLVGTASPLGGLSSSIRLRIASCVPMGSSLEKRLSSLRMPSKRCSVSMHWDRNVLASYRAKKMLRRARSVYRSNMSDASAHYLSHRGEPAEKPKTSTLVETARWKIKKYSLSC